MWHYLMCCHYPMCLPCFPILILSSLYLMIFRHPYLTHTKSNFGNFNAHLLFRFPLEKKSCLQTLRRFYGITNFSRYPFYQDSMKIKMAFAKYETLGFEF
jgi:hypothetical protein